MYKIYINPSKNNGYGSSAVEMKELADIITNRIVQEDNMIVYVEKDELTAHQAANSDLCLELKTSYGKGQGIRVIVNETDKKSQGFGKEIYNRIQKLYYDKSIDNGISYEKFSKERHVVLKIIYNENNKDVLWLETNKIQIGTEIAEGIIAGFRLLPC